MSETTFDINVFIRESKEVLLNPKSYFATMKTTGGLVEPIIKALIYGAVAGVLSFLWSILHLSFGGMFGGAFGIMILIWAVVGAVIGLFIMAVIILVISAICKGNQDFEACTRVAAAVMVVMPISALLGFLSGLNLTLGSVVSLAVNIFALYLLYHALVECLKANISSAKIAMLVVTGLIVIFFLVGLGARKKVSKMDSEMKELLEEFKK
jgi:hypothetical protein